MFIIFKQVLSLHLFLEPLLQVFQSLERSKHIARYKDQLNKRGDNDQYQQPHLAVLGVKRLYASVAL
jgi:hypothetical protein